MASESGGLGGLDMNALLGKAREMQDRMRAAGEAASRIICDGDAGGGMVKVKANGHGVLVAVTVDPIAFKAADREMLEDLILAAANQALTRAREAAEGEIKKITGGLLLPVDLTKFS
jgi:DNA-binding YbaB/EbfC family protein